MAMLNNQRVYVKVNEWGILSMQPTIFWCDQWRFCVLVDEWQYLGEFCLGSTSAWSWYIPKLIWTTVCRFKLIICRWFTYCQRWPFSMAKWLRLPEVIISSKASNRKRSHPHKTSSTSVVCVYSSIATIIGGCCTVTPNKDQTRFEK